MRRTRITAWDLFVASRVRDLIDYLQGTCKSLEEGLEQMGISELTQDEHAVLDGEIFCCDTCSWWCEASEEAEEFPGRCTDCHPEED